MQTATMMAVICISYRARWRQYAARMWRMGLQTDAMSGALTDGEFGDLCIG